MSRPAEITAGIVIAILIGLAVLNVAMQQGACS